MNRPPLFVLGLFGWLALELTAFMAVVETIGLAGALFSASRRRWRGSPCCAKQEPAL